jgi:hypothetical protein
MAATSQSSPTQIRWSCGRGLKTVAEVGRDEILAAAARLWEAGKEAERKEASHGAWGFALEVAGPNDSGHVRRPRSWGPADPSQL